MSAPREGFRRRHSAGRLLVCVVALVLAGVLGCGNPPATTSAAGQGRIWTDPEVSAVLPGVVNAACPLPGTLTGGQISHEDVERLRRAGIRTVLDLRLPSEPRGFDEAAQLRRAGLRYVSLPVRGDGIPDSTFDAVRAFMRNRSEPVLVHCASGNRVGAVLLPVLVLDAGLAPDSALVVARRVGLHGDEIRLSAERYLSDRRGAPTPGMAPDR